jgi:hypothetical protein
MRKYKFLVILLAAGLLFLPLNVSSAAGGLDAGIQLVPATTPGWTFTGTQAGSLLGYSWMPAGDVNGDSYDD